MRRKHTVNVTACPFAVCSDVFSSREPSQAWLLCWGSFAHWGCTTASSESISLKCFQSYSKCHQGPYPSSSHLLPWSTQQVDLEFVMSSLCLVHRGMVACAGAKGMPRELGLSGLSAVGTVCHRMLCEMWWLLLFSVFSCARIEII